MQILGQNEETVTLELTRKEAFALCAVYHELGDYIIPKMVRNRPLRQVFRDFSYFLSKDVFNGCIQRNKNKFYEEIFTRGLVHKNKMNAEEARGER